MWVRRRVDMHTYLRMSKNMLISTASFSSKQNWFRTTYLCQRQRKKEEKKKKKTRKQSLLCFPVRLGHPQFQEWYLHLQSITQPINQSIRILCDSKAISQLFTESVSHHQPVNRNPLWFKIHPSVSRSSSPLATQSVSYWRSIIRKHNYLLFSNMHNHNSHLHNPLQ